MAINSSDNEDLIIAQRAIGTLAYSSAARGQREIALMKNPSGWGSFKIVNGNLVMVITAQVDPLPATGPRARSISLEEFQNASTLVDSALPCELCDGSGLRMSVPDHPGYGWIKCECWV